MSQNPWLWDSTRQAYYYWSQEQNCFVYQDSTTVQGPQQTSPIPNPINPRRDTLPEARHAFQQEVNDGYSNVARRFSTNTGFSSPGADDLSQQMGALEIGSSNQPQYSTTYSPYTTQAATIQPQYGSSSGEQAQPYGGGPAFFQVWPKEEITDKQLYQQGVRARGKIRGTKGRSEKLDKSYFIREDGRKFFRVGKVIKILWPELPGNNTEGVTVVSDTRFHDENFITKIRWFVVIKEGRESCTCVPISTYGGRGCGKPGLAKWQHCMVYTEDEEEPDLLPGEEPGPGEYPMRSAIQVKKKDKGQKMFPASRINFGKMYTVEHNVKVFEFGDVRRSYLKPLVKQWQEVLLNGTPADADNNESGGALGSLEEESSGDDDEVLEAPMLPIHGTALHPWSDNTQENQLAFEKNDRILVTMFPDENWAKGRNESTRYEGLFPQNYVQLDRPDHATALRDVAFDKKKPDRLAFKKGDRILVKSYDSPSWDIGKNTKTGREGKYPQGYVKMDRGRFATALYDYANNDEKPDHLVFQAKDRILVLHGDNTGWARGRNESTRQEGRFPGNYVQFND